MLVLTLAVLLTGGVRPMAAQDELNKRRVRWGVDDAGSPSSLSLHPKAGALFEEFGFDLWVMHYSPSPNTDQNAEHIRRVNAWCGENDVDWVANLETANWIASHVDEKGRDWYNRADGRHFFLFPDELLEELSRAERLVGLMYDEAAHMQNCRNKIARVDQPWIFNPAGHTLDEAADAFVDAAGEVARQHQRHDLTLYTEHVFPVLFHPLARSGWVAGTKILKENWSPAYIACALGAALEYDTELWITPDLWGMPGYPGHSLDEYRSSLLLAYHMGADCIYTENLAYDDEKKGIGSLVLMTKDDYGLTEYGEITKWFGREYMPANPRGYSFREVRPRVAIVRQPDACWGQSESWLPNALFGNEEWPSDETTEAWLGIWHVLSRGVIPEYSLSWHNAKLAKRPYQVFCPLDGVVVFDHHVEEKHLRDVEVIFLTGLGVSEQTRKAIGECVRRGAACVALPQLLPERVRRSTGDEGVFADGKGKWVAARDFTAPHVRPHVAHVIPQDDVIRYRFGGKLVTFRPLEGDPNRLTVSVE